MIQKFIFTILTMCFLTHSSLCQSTEIVFNSGIALLTKSDFKSEKLNRASGNSAASIFLQSCSTDSYEEYQSSFSPGECHVDLETFTSWKSSFGQHIPRIEASFSVNSNGLELAAIQYSLSYDGKKYMLGQLLKKVNDEWKFLSLDENRRLYYIGEFFSLVSEKLMVKVTQKGEVDSTDDLMSIYKDDKINADQVIKNLLDRYDTTSEYYKLLTEYFINPIQGTERRSSSLDQKIFDYFSQGKIPSESLEQVINLYLGFQEGLAIQKFAELTAQDPMSVYTEIRELKSSEE